MSRITISDLQDNLLVDVQANDTLQKISGGFGGYGGTFTYVGVSSPGYRYEYFYNNGAYGYAYGYKNGSSSGFGAGGNVGFGGFGGRRR